LRRAFALRARAVRGRAAPCREPLVARRAQANVAQGQSPEAFLDARQEDLPTGKNLILSASFDKQGEDGAEGVLFAHGARFGGHALYVKDNRLHYVYDFVGALEQKVVADERAGRRNRDTRLSEYRPAWRSSKNKVGEATIRTQPGKFVVGGEGLCIGRDSGAGVTDDYPGTMPWSFTGGTIRRVAVDVSGDPYVDLEREAAAMLMREY
jgi:hypothetical protein